MEDRLLFIIGSPRSGSTLLSRVLGAHSQIFAPAEPHLLTPLAHLGFYETVERAPYDPIIAQRGIRELVARLPDGEVDYLAALRAYTDALYAGLLEPTGRRYLLDKTPAYALVLEFAARLYPAARYVVLTRHPMAIWSSVVDSFFDGDHVAAHAHNPILERYVPAIARFLRKAPVPIHPVRYEAFVKAPEEQVAALCDFIGVPFEPAMVDYGAQGDEGPAARGLGDPMTVARETRPTTASLSKWARQLSGRPERVEQCLAILDALDPEDLRTWGYEKGAIRAELEQVDPSGRPPARARLSRYTLERRALVAMRRRVGDNALGRLVRKVREVCDLLLR